MANNKEIKIEVEEKIYPLSSVIAVSYKFLDYYYISLDSANKEKIRINIKSKKKIEDSKHVKIKEDFLNELLYARARMDSAKKNKKIREFVVGRALFSVAEEETPEEEFNKDDPLDLLRN